MRNKYGGSTMKAILLIVLFVNIPFSNLRAGAIKTDFKSLEVPESLTAINYIGEASDIKPSKNMMPDKDSTNLRTIYVFTEIGILEAAAFGLGYQINKTFSVALKISSSWTGHAIFLPSLSTGPGVIFSIHNKFLFFNVINMEYSLFYASNLISNISTSFPVGGGASLNIGREDIYAKGINFFWAVGFNFNYLKNWSPNTYAPCLKIGLNINI
jgi:hypothetical protein